MDLLIKIMALIAMSVLLLISVWGFVLFYRYINDVRKQNIMLFTILDKLGSKIKDLDSITKSNNNFKL